MYIIWLKNYFKSVLRHCVCTEIEDIIQSRVAGAVARRVRHVEAGGVRERTLAKDAKSGRKHRKVLIRPRKLQQLLARRRAVYLELVGQLEDKYTKLYEKQFFNYVPESSEENIFKAPEVVVC